MIDFDADTHSYYHDGRRVPAVSDILAAALPDPYAGIDERTLEHARQRGVAVDRAIQQYLREQRVDVPCPDDCGVAQYAMSYIEWEGMTGWRSIANQVQLYDPQLRVAGTCDEVGWLNGLLTLTDWKCKAAKSERDLYQVAGYVGLWNGMHPELQVRQGRVLYLQADGKCAKAVPVDLGTYQPQFVRLIMEYGATGGEA